jgi:HTH-type transcriptional regulator/antitoxin HigA
MEIRPIKTDQDHADALSEIEHLMFAEAGTPEGDRLEILVTLVEAFERKHHLLDYPDPIDAIKFEMERRGLTVQDLEPMIGRKNRVYEVLSHKRQLTVGMIRRLHRELGIPAECLLGEPAAA